MDAIKPAPERKVLLIVEDELLPAILLRDELADAGFHVLDLTDRPGEAIAAARDCHPDLALVNIVLQGRDHGIELARQFKAMGIPVLLISGQRSGAKSAQTAAIASLPKPYDAADMVAAVRYLMGHIDGDDSLPRPDRLQVFDGLDAAPEAV